MADISKIQTLDGATYDIKDNIARQNIPFGVTDSTSTSTAYTATVPGITALTNGTICYIMNNIITSAENCTININNLGAKPLYMTNTATTRVTTQFATGYTWMLVYNTTRVDDGCWDLIYLFNTNTNTIGYQLRTNSTVMKTYDQSRYYRLFFTSADGTHWVPANTAKDNSATSTKIVNQRPIDPFGRIIYYGASTNLSAESDVSAAYCWDQYTFSLGYSFNMNGKALTLTTETPVYIKCAPQSDGSAIIDSTTPYVQSLPSSEDGKIYIFLGAAYSATNVELVQCHPIYYYKDNAIRLWTNQNIEEIPTKVSDLTNDSGFITGMEILSYGSSTWNDFLAAYTAKKVVYCRASSNSNPASGSQTRLAFMAYVNNASSPTSVEFQYYRSVSSHTNAQQGDQVYVYTLTSAGTWTVTVREAYTKIVAGTNMTSSYSDGTLTLNATGGGTSDYDDLTDKPSINDVTLSGSKTAADLGLGTYSKPSDGIPASDLASAVQTSLSLADSALQSVPSAYRTAAEQDVIDANLDAGKVDKAGDTMTGTLKISMSDSGFVAKSTSRDSSQTVATSTNSVGFRVKDKNEVNVAVYSDRYENTGENGAFIAGTRVINGSSIWNSLKLLVNTAGDLVVKVASAAAWRKALDLCYAPNDTLTQQGRILPGVVSNSGKKIQFEVTLSKSIENISTITVTAMVGALAGVNGYMDGNNTTSVAIKEKADCTVSAAKITDNVVRIVIDKTTAFTNAVSGAPCVYWGTFTLKFT